jgi:hypothetical protein
METQNMMALKAKKTMNVLSKKENIEGLGMRICTRCIKAKV